MKMKWLSESSLTCPGSPHVTHWWDHAACRNERLPLTSVTEGSAPRHLFTDFITFVRLPSDVACFLTLEEAF